MTRIGVFCGGIRVGVPFLSDSSSVNLRFAFLHFQAHSSLLIGGQMAVWKRIDFSVCRQNERRSA